ncbi:VOC family protein [Cryomorpha ignava]|uniref:VOC family protein n=1 Tax=Cryomorpha ignava TaxID=101383 RepID=A0A7K3WN90_9FLAO|nr:VOC family protein [Cryomorpha ignava]NEN22332.1 VOC family protein [Cryomorpha ignava]
MGSTTGRKMKTETKLKDFVSWFEIPALNFEKAVAFYDHIYNIKMERVVSSTHSMAVFPTSSGVGGAVVHGPGSIPGQIGPLLYLNGGKDLETILSRVPDAGGRIIMPKTFINEESGYFAIFIDSEGNKLALHSE